MMNGKRIGFVDLKLENFHANVYLEAIRGELVARGFTIAGCFALDEADGRAWAAVAVLPVPIAHTGSYASTIRSISSLVRPDSDPVT